MIVSSLIVWLVTASAPPAHANGAFIDVDALDPEEQTAPVPPPVPRPRRSKVKQGPGRPPAPAPATPPSTTPTPKGPARTEPTPQPRPNADPTPPLAVHTAPPAPPAPDPVKPRTTPPATTPPKTRPPTTPPTTDTKPTRSAKSPWICSSDPRKTKATDDPAQVKAMIEDVLKENAFKVSYRSQQTTKLGKIQFKLTSLGNEMQIVMTAIRDGEPPQALGVSPAVFCIQGEGDHRSIRVGMQASRLTFGNGFYDAIVRGYLGNDELPMLLSPTGVRGTLNLKDGIKNGGLIDTPATAQ